MERRIRFRRLFQDSSDQQYQQPQQQGLGVSRRSTLNRFDSPTSLTPTNTLQTTVDPIIITRAIHDYNDDDEDNNTIYATTTQPLHRSNTTTYTSHFTRPKVTTILSLPQKLLQWIYSISLILILLLLLLVISVTILDVVIQTLQSPSDLALKTFTVLGACGFFIFISIIIYFVRLYQLRVSINNIPNKSLYIPFENDFANKAIFHYIDDKLKYCHEIKFKSGPLQNAMYIINHPGLSPPEYIMKRNAQCLTNMNRNVFPMTKQSNGDLINQINESSNCGGSGIVGEGTLLPPNIHYEDVIRSFGDKFYTGKIFTNDALPIELSIQEIIIYLTNQFSDQNNNNNNNNNNHKPNINKLISLYEKFRFSNQLINQRELIEFMIEFDKFGQMCQNDYQIKFPRSISHSRNNSTNKLRKLSRLGGKFSGFDLSDYSSAALFDDDDDEEEEEEEGVDYNQEYNSEYDDDYKEEEDYDDNSSSNNNPFQHYKVESKYFEKAVTNSDDNDNNNDNLENSSSLNIRGLHHQSSFSSTKSVIRNKLALGNRPSLLKYDSHTSGNTRNKKQRQKRNEVGNNSDDNDDDEYYQLLRKQSGYITDSENEGYELNSINNEEEEEEEDEEEEEEEEEGYDQDDQDDDDEEQFYQFRRGQRTVPEITINQELNQQQERRSSNADSIKHLSPTSSIKRYFN